MTTTTLRWNRHNATCTGISSTGNKCGGCGSDPATRQQRQAYALLVTLALTGGRMVCPLTGEPLTGGAVEVDRIIPALGYVPGNVYLASVTGNQGRAALQSAGSDLPGIARLASDILAASATVTVPATGSASAAVVAMLAKQDRLAAVLAGPYGQA